jgi:hypothetical protein
VKEDPKQPSIELITFRLGELKMAVDVGFNQLAQRFDALEGRLRDLEDWRTAADAVDKKKPKLNTQTVAITLLSLLGVVATIIAIFK